MYSTQNAVRFRVKMIPRQGAPKIWYTDKIQKTDTGSLLAIHELIKVPCPKSNHIVTGSNEEQAMARHSPEKNQYTVSI